jgi:hypothetical protein
MLDSPPSESRHFLKEDRIYALRPDGGGVLPLAVVTVVFLGWGILSTETY